MERGEFIARGRVAGMEADDERARSDKQYAGLRQCQRRAYVVQLGERQQFLRTQGFAGLGIERTGGTQVVAEFFAAHRAAGRRKLRVRSSGAGWHIRNRRSQACALGKRAVLVHGACSCL
jgi:hypothetical protein